MVKLLSDRITANFRLSEFANKSAGNVMVLNPDVVDFIFMLQEFREWYGRPININSGYRTVEHNKRVGGASNSYHLKGLAIDFSLPMAEFNGYTKARQDEFLNNVKYKWYSICAGKGLTGSIIFYDTYIHMSLWPTWYFDDKRKGA